MEREGTKTEKGGQHTGPEIPKRAQKCAAYAKIKYCAQKSTQHQIKPQFPFCCPQGITDQPCRHAKTEEYVTQDQKLRIPPPQRAQQVVGQSQNTAQQSRAQKERKLLGNIVLHPQPNSRESRLPRSRGASS